MTIEVHRPLRLDEPQQRQPQCALTGAALADDAQRLALAHLQGNVVDGLDVVAGPPQQSPFDGKPHPHILRDRKSTRLNSSHVKISYAVFRLKTIIARTRSAT